MDQATDDLNEELVRAAARSKLFGAALNAPRLGRFTVLERVGAGAMGEVFAAYDPQLDRKVAIKLLRPPQPAGPADESGLGTRTTDAGPTATTPASGLGEPDRSARADRLLSEARALARLSHPNVIAVHEVGTHGSSVFVAMEFVDGETLRSFCRSEQRSWREILAAFLAAGRGLSAAHAAGMVHRDFKPENVMVDRSGRARVLDFGLARAFDDAGPRETEGRDASPGPAATVTGAIAGTPAYMAPEVHSGSRADARSDQYSFCAALYEALWGRRPFVGDTLAALVYSVLNDDVPEPPPSDVPPHIFRAVRRGLSRDPAARFSSMEELCAALGDEPGLRRRRRFLWAGGATGAAALALGLAAMLRSDPEAELCGGGRARLVGAWDEARKAAVFSAFHAVDKPYAASAWATVEGALDAWSARLLEVHLETCRATRLRGERSDEMLDLSMTCLDRRTAELRALTGLFAQADADVVEHAADAATRLPSPAGCADAHRLALPVPPPEDPDALAAVVRIQEELAGLRARRAAGRYAEAEPPAAVLVERARATEHRPTLAEALAMHAQLLDDIGRVDDAIARGRDALLEAESGRHDELVATGRTWLVHVLAVNAARPAEGLAMAREARAALDRLGGDPALEATLAMYRANATQAAGEWDEARRLAAEALALAEKAHGADHVETATALHNLGTVLQSVGASEEAIPLHDRSIAIWTAVFGPDHPEVAFGYSSRANALWALGRAEEALAGNERALAIWEKALGPDHPRVGSALNNVGVCLIALGRGAEARAILDRAETLWQRTDPDNPERARVLNSLGQLDASERRLDSAMERFGRAADLVRKAEGEASPTAATMDANRALLLVDGGRATEAIPLLLQSVTRLEAAAGPDSPVLIEPLSTLADAHLQRRDLRAALLVLRRADALARAGGGDPETAANIQRRLATLEAGR